MPDESSKSPKSFSQDQNDYLTLADEINLDFEPPFPSLKPVMVLPQRFVLWVIVCTMIPSCVVAGFAYQINYQSRRENARQTQELRAKAIADSLNNQVLREYDNTKKLALELAPNLQKSNPPANKSSNKPADKPAEIPANKPVNKPAIKPIINKAASKQLVINRMKSAQKSSKIATALAIYDLRGNLILAPFLNQLKSNQLNSNQLNSNHLTNHLDSDVLNRVIRFSSPVLAQVNSAHTNSTQANSTQTNSTQTNSAIQPAIQFVVPILIPKTQKIQALLVAQISVSNLHPTFTTADYAEEYIIADANQKVLFSTASFNQIKPQKPLASIGLDNFLSAKTPSLPGLPDLNWSILVKLDLAPDYIYILVLAICILILVTLVAIITYFAGRRFSLRLGHATAAIAQSQFEQPLSELGSDEIAQLATQINRMNSNYQALENRQKRTVDELQRLIAKGVHALHKVIETNGEESTSGDFEAIASHLKASLVKKQTDINLLNRQLDRLNLQFLQKETEAKLFQNQILGREQQITALSEAHNEELKTSTEQYKLILQEIIDEVEQKQAEIAQKNSQIQELQSQLAQESKAMQAAESQLQILINNFKLKQSSPDGAISPQNLDLMAAQVQRLREAIAVNAKKAKRLSESVQKIAKVRDLIQETGAEANFLAVNAGIKASREQNSDFRVFSDQVGKLATMTAMAMSELEQLGKNIQSETTEVMINLEQGTGQIAEITKLIAMAQADFQDAEIAIKRISETESSLCSELSAISFKAS